jgi:putative ABC transport system permease protein
MLRTTLHNIAARKLRLLSTGIAVVLGVAFMAGTLVLTDTIGRTFDALFADANAGVDAYVRSADVTGDGMMRQRGRVDDDLVTTVAAVDGVVAAEGTVQGYAELLDRDGSAMGTSGTGVQTHGASWIDAGGLNPFTLESGRAPVGTGEVVIDRGSAKRAGFVVGDRTAVLTQRGRAEVEIVGIARFGDADSPAGASFTFFDLATAQQLLSSPGRLDAIRIAGDPAVSDAELASRIEDSVPPHVEVLTGAEITAENQSDSKDSLSFFNTFLLTFALIALFVGSFIIHNTFSILVAQRSQETALLRAIGASRRQVFASVLAEASAVGLIASFTGVGAGIGVAAGLKALFGAMGIDIPADGLVIAPSTVVISVITGLAVSVAAALAPARRAGRVAPVAAMREAAGGDEVVTRKRMLAGALVVVFGAVAMISGLFAGTGVATVGLGTALVFLGVALLGPLMVGPVIRVIGAPLARAFESTGVIARQNALRNPRRTSATAAALVVGVALVGTMTVLAESAKASVDETIESSFRGDLVIDSGSMGGAGLSPELAGAVAELPQIDAVTGVRMAPADVDGEAADVVAIDPRTVDRLFDLGRLEGAVDELDDGNRVAVSADVAAERGLAIGDSLPVRFAETGVQQMTVSAVYTKADIVGDFVVGLRTFDANVATRLDLKIFASVADGSSADQAKAAVQHVTEAFPQAEVQDRAEFADATGAQIDAMLNLVYALLLLAILIALIGIANTLALSMIERTRELGLLRAVGMTRRQLRATIRWESILVAMLGTVVGLVVGGVFGWALVEALEEQGITTFVLPGGRLATIAVLAALAGLGAAVVPARRAARLDVLDAIASV